MSPFAVLDWLERHLTFPGDLTVSSPDASAASRGEDAPDGASPAPSGAPTDLGRRGREVRGALPQRGARLPSGTPGDRPALTHPSNSPARRKVLRG